MVRDGRVQEIKYEHFCDTNLSEGRKKRRKKCTRDVGRERERERERMSPASKVRQRERRKLKVGSGSKLFIFFENN